MSKGATKNDQTSDDNYNGFYYSYINPIQDGPFRDCSWIGGGQKGPLPKICHTYPAMMKLGTVIPYLKKIQKIYKSRDTPFSSADISIFSPEINNFCYIKKYRYSCILIHNL